MAIEDKKKRNGIEKREYVNTCIVLYQWGCSFDICLLLLLLISLSCSSRHSVSNRVLFVFSLFACQVKFSSLRQQYANHSIWSSLQIYCTCMYLLCVYSCVWIASSNMEFLNERIPRVSSSGLPFSYINIIKTTNIPIWCTSYKIRGRKGRKRWSLYIHSKQSKTLVMEEF